MSSQTLLHGNSNNEIKHRNREKMLEETKEYGNKHREPENRCHNSTVCGQTELLTAIGTELFI